jgi:hypothetical protein
MACVAGGNRPVWSKAWLKQYQKNEANQLSGTLEYLIVNIMTIRMESMLCKV